MAEPRCDWSDLLVSQCSHCRPPVEEPAPLDGQDWDYLAFAGRPRPSLRAKGEVHTDYRFRYARKGVGHMPDTIADDYLEDD